jgi:NADH-ubiquinone oxidoreductase chain 3
MTLFILIVSVIALLFLFINLVFAPHNPYQEKDSMFECGFHSFQQSRLPFNIAFFIYALVYLLLDLEILLTFPFSVSEYINDLYGLAVALFFVSVVTLGFAFEIGKNALKISSKQYAPTIKDSSSYIPNISFIKTNTKINTNPHINNIFGVRKFSTSRCLLAPFNNGHPDKKNSDLSKSHHLFKLVSCLFKNNPRLNLFQDKLKYTVVIICFA